MNKIDVDCFGCKRYDGEICLFHNITGREFCKKIMKRKELGVKV